MASNNSRKMAELASAQETTTQTTAWIPRDVYAKAVFMAVHAKRILGNLTAAVQHDIGAGEGNVIKVRFYPKRTAQGPISEGTALNYNADTPTVTPITIQKYGDYAQLTDEAIQFTSDDVRGRLLAEMGAALAETLEQVVVNGLTGTITGCSTQNCATAGVIDYHTVLNAASVLKAAKLNPDFLILSPDHEVDLLLDSNLTKLVDYGPGEVTFAGEVGRIGQIKVIVHPLMPAKSTTSGAVQAVLIDSTRAWGEAFGKPLRFEEFRVIEQDIWKEVAWAWYGMSTLDPVATCQIKNA
jgi:N4-gp56 family major capsid protein